MLLRTVKWVRNNPKKTIFASFCTAYGANYTYTKYNDAYDLTCYCRSLAPLGEDKLAVPSFPPRITVFVNYRAYRGKLLKTFDALAAPMLNLAGFDVQMVYPEFDSEIKDYLAIFDPSKTDAILVVGDDNVLQQALTGLLRRADAEGGHLHNLPIGIIPYGLWNSFTRLPTGWRNLVEYVVQTCPNSLTFPPPSSRTFAFVNPIAFSHTDYQNVMEISPLEANAKPIYALAQLDWNLYRDIECLDRNWKPTDAAYQRDRLLEFYHSPLQMYRWISSWVRHSWAWRKVTALDSAELRRVPEFLALNQSVDSQTGKTRNVYRLKHARIQYTQPCAGCPRCTASPGSSEVPQPAVKEKSFLRKISFFKATRETPARAPAPPEPPVKQPDYVPGCGLRVERSIDAASSVRVEMRGERLFLTVEEAPSSYHDHVRRSFAFLRSHPTRIERETPPEVIECTSVSLYPDGETNEHFWIDNDHFPACPIRVRIRRGAVRLFKPDDFALSSVEDFDD